MSIIFPLLPRLTVNRAFMSAFLAAQTPCFALGMVEERGRACGFLAVRPGELIPPDSTDTGFQFGHSLVGTASFEVVHFGFAFYGFKTYNVLINPNNPLVRTVLRGRQETTCQGGVWWRGERGARTLGQSAQERPKGARHASPTRPSVPVCGVPAGGELCHTGAPSADESGVESAG